MNAKEAFVAARDDMVARADGGSDDWPVLVQDLTVAYHHKPVLWDIDLTKFPKALLP